MNNGLRRFIATKLVLLLVICVIAGVIQAAIVDTSALDTSAKIWRLPEASGGALSFCIHRVCGWPSITLLIVSPLVAALASLAFDFSKTRELRSLLERGLLTPFENFFFQFQSVIVVCFLIGNVILGGAFSTTLFYVSDLASLITSQTLLACIAFVSFSLAMLSETSSKQKS